MTTITRPARRPFTQCKTLAAMLLIGLLCMTSARAQSGAGTIYGRIMDAGSEKSLPSADIAIEGTNVLTQSDQSGFYTVSSVTPGEVTIVVTYAGYDTEKKTVAVGPGERVPLDFSLKLVTIYRPGITAANVTDKNRDEVIVLEKITVSTDRAGTSRAFMEQKNSMNMTNVVSTDSFGTVQGGNVADFLKNLPGITLGYDDTGDASTISIGGMDAQYANVTMDGAEMASGAKAEFGATSRQFQFDQVSINGIESIAVNKTLSADMPGDKPAGSIDLRPKSAFDNKRPVFIYDVYLKMNSNEMTLGRTPNPAGGGQTVKILPGFRLAYSAPFNEGTMGLTINLNREQTYKNRGQVTNTYGNWNRGIPFVKKVAYTNAPSNDEKINAGLRYDWKISPFAKLNFSFSYGLTNQYIHNYNINFNPGGSEDDYYNTPDTSNLTIYRGSDGSGARVTTSGGSSYSTGYTDAFTLYFEWKRNRFRFDTQAAFTYSKSELLYSQAGFFSEVPMNSTRYHDVFTMTRSSSRSTDWVFKQGPKGILLGETPPSASSPGTAANAYSNSNVSDIGVYAQTGASSIADPIPKNGANNIPSVKANLRWDAPTVFPLWFKTGLGGKKDIRNFWEPTNAAGGKLNNTYQYIGTGIAGQFPGSAGANYDNQNKDSGGSPVSIGMPPPGEAPWLSSTYYQNAYRFDPRMGGNITELNMPFVDRTLLYQTFQQHPEWFYMRDDYFQDGVPGSTTADLNAYRASMAGPKNLRETTAFLYLMGEMRPWTRFTFQAGVRYEYTNQTADTLIPYTKLQMEAMGWDSSKESSSNDAFEYAKVQYKNGERTRTEKNYAFWLPSVNMKYNFNPNFVGHLAYNESFARVDVSKIAGQWKVSDGNNPNATAPNPTLEPDHFKTYAASIEYYFEPAGTFTMTYTYRKWHGLSYDKKIIDPDSVTWNALVRQYGEAVMNAFRDDNYIVYSFDDSDAEDRHIQALEFNYSQRIPFIPGLRVNATFTRIIPSWRKTGEESGSMPATPKTASGSVQYTYRNFSINVRGLWTDRTWVALGTDEYTMRANYARFTLDMDLTYRLSQRLGLYVSGANVLNESKSSFINNASVLYQEDKYGASWQIGLKGTF